MRRVLFTTWDSGDTDYLTSLFFPTFVALRARGVIVDTLQMTWADDQHVQAITSAAQRLGLGYHVLRVDAATRKTRFPQHLYRLSREMVRLTRELQAEVLMPRAIVPAAAAFIARFSLKGVRLVWDADGLPADERVDFAGWSKRGLPYLGMRTIERWIGKRADRVMVRTQHAKEVLAERTGSSADAEKIVVVPNGRDERSYVRDEEARAAIRGILGASADAPVLISVGSQGPQYLTDQQVRLIQAVFERRDDARAVLLTAANELVFDALQRHGVDQSRVRIQRVPASEVPRWLSASDVGIALRRGSFSQQAVSPLKVGEYLLTGVPVVATLGVGDLDRILQPTFSHVVDPDALDLQAFVEWVDDVAARRAFYTLAARDAGVEYFGMQAMLDGYAKLLDL